MSRYEKNTINLAVSTKVTITMTDLQNFDPGLTCEPHGKQFQSRCLSKI